MATASRTTTTPADRTAVDGRGRSLVGHCRASDYNHWEQRHTCVACAHPLADNDLVKDAYKLNTSAAWAKAQLRILHDMAKDRGGMDWFAEQAQKIANGIQLLGAQRQGWPAP